MSVKLPLEWALALKKLVNACNRREDGTLSSGGRRLC